MLCGHHRKFYGLFAFFYGSVSLCFIADSQTVVSCFKRHGRIYKLGIILILVYISAALKPIDIPRIIIVGYELKQLPVFFASSLNFSFGQQQGLAKTNPREFVYQAVLFISVPEELVISAKKYESVFAHFLLPPSDFFGFYTGKVATIVVPTSELSSTQTSPLCSAAISQTSDSPNPTPPYSRLRDLSTRKKG